MKKVFVFGLLFFVFASAIHSYGQTCTVNPSPIAASTNFSSLSWTSTGGAVCPPAGNFVGNVTINLANGVTVTMDADITINGNFNITNNGTSTLTIPAGVDVHVTGDMGDDDNNNVVYNVNGTLVVDGTLYGKNNTSFTGSGSISGGTLNVGNGTTCSSPCPVSGGFQNCTSNGGANTFCNNNNVLPIGLVYFTAEGEGEQVVLNWATSWEENFDKFVVERSRDGVAFTTLAEVPGAGRNISDLLSEYSAVDRFPMEGLNYYRLKSVDLDLSFDYSRVIVFGANQGRKFVVQPNPASKVISYQINFEPQEGDRVVLVDQMGRVLMETQASPGENQFDVPPGATTGIYYLKYFSGAKQFFTRVVLK